MSRVRVPSQIFIFSSSQLRLRNATCAVYAIKPTINQVPTATWPIVPHLLICVSNNCHLIVSLWDPANASTNQRIPANPEIPDHRIDNEPKSIWERISITDIVMSFATVVIAGATIWNVIYVGGQLHEMQSSSGQTDKLIETNSKLADAAKDQATAARDQAKAAIESAKTANEALIAARTQVRTIQDQEIRSLRAYVGIPPNTLKLSCDQCGVDSKIVSRAPSQNVLILDLRNYGKTPAYKPWICGGFLKSSENGRISTEDVDKSFMDCDNQFNELATMPMIGPSETRHHSVPINILGVELISDAVSHHKDIFFVGRIKFVDAFKNSRTNYACFIYVHDTDGMTFRGCSDHNDPDD